MKPKLIIWILVLLILTTSTFALGIRPAKTTINFESGLEKEYIFYIVNNEKQPLTINLQADGVLKDYITFEQNEITLSSEESIKEIKYKIDLPQELTPGLNLGQVIVTQQPAKITGMATGMSANLRLIHKIMVLAPYPDRYVDIDIRLRIRDKESDIITEIRNSGTKRIECLTSLIEVYDNNKKIKDLVTNPIGLNPTETKQYYLVIGHDLLTPGEYDVLANVLYDGQEIEVTRKLFYGEPKIEIINLDKFFLEKEVNDLRLEIKNQWNKQIDNIYGEIVVKRNNKEIYSDQTVSFSLPEQKTDVIKAFIDAKDIEAGEAELFITLNYFDKKETYQTQIEFLTQEDYEKRLKEVEVITIPGGRFTYIILIIMTLMILALIILILIPGRRRRMVEYIKR